MLQSGSIAGLMQSAVVMLMLHTRSSALWKAVASAFSCASGRCMKSGSAAAISAARRAMLSHTCHMGASQHIDSPHSTHCALRHYTRCQPQDGASLAEGSKDCNAVMSPPTCCFRRACSCASSTAAVVAASGGGLLGGVSGAAGPQS